MGCHVFNKKRNKINKIVDFFHRKDAKDAKLFLCAFLAPSVPLRLFFFTAKTQSTGRKRIKAYNLSLQKPNYFIIFITALFTPSYRQLNLLIFENIFLSLSQNACLIRLINKA